MSLVAYASSDESEPDEAEPEPEEEEAAAPTSGPTLGGLFASLPAPKGPALLPPPPQMLAPAFPPPLLLPPPAGDPRLQPPPPLPFGLGGFPPPPGVSPAEAAGAGEGLGLPSPRGPGLGLPPSMGGAGPPLGLPKPKKRTEPVKIAAPELHQGDSDSEEDEPSKKKTVLQVSFAACGGRLFPAHAACRERSCDARRSAQRAQGRCEDGGPAAPGWFFRATPAPVLSALPSRLPGRRRRGGGRGTRGLPCVCTPGIVSGGRIGNE